MVSPHDYIPGRGDVIQLHDQQAGRGDHVLALVISPLAYNARLELVLACPLAAHPSGYPFEVRIPDDLGARGVVVADRVRSLDWRAYHGTLVCTLPEATVNEVLARLTVLLAS